MEQMLQEMWKCHEYNFDQVLPQDVHIYQKQKVSYLEQRGFTRWSPGDTGTRSTLSSWALWVRRFSGLELRISSHTDTNWRH